MLFMFHASAPFKGGEIQHFGEGRREGNLYRGFWHFMGRLDNPLETMGTKTNSNEMN